MSPREPNSRKTLRRDRKKRVACSRCCGSCRNSVAGVAFFPLLTSASVPELVVVGGGRMGSALVSGLIRSGWAPESIAIVEKSRERREELSQLLGDVRVEADVSASVGDVGCVLAVKPTDAREACAIAAGAGAGRVVSIMAGVPISALERWLAPMRPAVVRAMPNTPALVGAGVAGLAAGESAGEDDVEWAESILGAVGRVVRVEESELDAVTGLSGSGPAYVFAVTEALAKAGEDAGLGAETSRMLARETVVGAGRLLEESGESPEELRAQVTSPGGTTEAGLAALWKGGLEKAVSDAVAAATQRSGALGAELGAALGVDAGAPSSGPSP